MCRSSEGEKERNMGIVDGSSYDRRVEIGFETRTNTNLTNEWRNQRYDSCCPPITVVRIIVVGRAVPILTVPPLSRSVQSPSASGKWGAWGQVHGAHGLRLRGCIEGRVVVLGRWRWRCRMGDGHRCTGGRARAVTGCVCAEHGIRAHHVRRTAREAGEWIIVGWAESSSVGVGIGRAVRGGVGEGCG